MIDCILCFLFPFLSPVNSFLHLFATFCSLLHSQHYLFIMGSIFLALAVGLITLWGGGGGVTDYILCLQCKRCLKIVIVSEHYLFIMSSIFCGTCCWALTDNMGGGGGGEGG